MVCGEAVVKVVPIPCSLRVRRISVNDGDASAKHHLQLLQESEDVFISVGFE